MRSATSQTAVSVARALLYLDRNPKTARLLPADAAEMTRRLLACVGRSTALVERASQYRFVRRLARQLENQVLPGFALHLGLRKRLVDDEVQEALGAGVRQVVILGAGFDTLAARLAPRYPQATFVELDQAQTSALKARALDRIGCAAPNLHLVVGSLGSTPFVQALVRQPFFDREATSCLLAEGLLMYLPPSHAAAALRCTASFPRGSRLIFSYLERRPDGELELGRASPVKRLAFSLLQEPLRWAVGPGGLDAELARHRLRRCKGPQATNLRRRYLLAAGLANAPLADVEKVCIAEPIGEA